MLIREVPVKKVWEIRHEVMYPKESIEFVKLENDEAGTHLGLYVDDKLVSVISLFEREDEVQFRKFATVIKEQGKGYGSRLLQYIIDWAKTNGMKSIWCNARISAIGLYEKFGMVKAGPGWENHGIAFIKMKKQLN